MTNDTFKNICIKAALESGKYIKENLGKIKTLSYKSKSNLVTNIDKSSEKLIVKIIRRSFPDHDIIAEEGAQVKRKSEYRWVIDPLDGTTNFVHGFPFFSVSIALENFKTKEIVVGSVFDPIKNELFYAQKGHGSFLNKKRICVSTNSKLKDSLLATGFAYNPTDPDSDNLKYFTKFIFSSQAIRRAGSAALDLSYVACGRFDGYWELGLKPWDTAAGILIVKEAGGRVTTINGSSFDPYKKEIVASNSLIHNKMLETFKKPMSSFYI